MKLTVTSSTALSFEYKPSENKLIIEFTSGNVYVYQNVPNILIMDLLETESFGKWFQKHIKKNPQKYPFVKLPLETKEKV
jgi:hypothetical protein